jgi:hypothetical protein
MTTTALRSHVLRRAVERPPRRGRERGAVHIRHRADRPDPYSADALSQARVARIMAEHELAAAIRDAESAYREAERLGRECDRRLARSRSLLRDAGYLRR